MPKIQNFTICIKDDITKIYYFPLNFSPVDMVDESQLLFFEDFNFIPDTVKCYIINLKSYIWKKSKR